MATEFKVGDKRGAWTITEIDVVIKQRRSNGRTYNVRKIRVRCDCGTELLKRPSDINGTRASLCCSKCSLKYAKQSGFARAYATPNSCK